MLKLAALDPEDLAIVSAHMQDAVVKAGGFFHSAARQQFALVANRYAWEETGQRQRRRTGLHFDRLLKVRSQNIRRDDKDAVLSLLSIGFEEGEAPGGDIVLNFSGGGTIRISVECIEAQLKDLGPAWATASTPTHPDGGSSSL